MTKNDPHGKPPIVDADGNCEICGEYDWQNDLAQIRLLAPDIEPIRDAVKRVWEYTEQLEQQLYEIAEHQKLIERFLEWDALNPLPEPLPAPFADFSYWIGELSELATDKNR